MRLPGELRTDQDGAGKSGVLVGQIRHQGVDLVAILAHAEARVSDGVTDANYGGLRVTNSRDQSRCLSNSMASTRPSAPITTTA
jgi:hypothetical protein